MKNTTEIEISKLIKCPRCLKKYNSGYEFMIHETTGKCTAAQSKKQKN